MTELRALETTRRRPYALTRQANDGFLFIVQSTGRTLGDLSSSTVKGTLKVWQALTGSREKSVQQPPKPSDAPPRQLDEKTEPAAPTHPYPFLPDLEALLTGHSPRDAEQAAVLRRCFDDLLLGSEEAGEAALKILVGLGQSVEPLLIACLPTDSPRVAKIALEGLSRIGSQRLVGCISDVLDSSDPELRMVALRAAVGLPHDRQMQRLLERGLRDPDANVKRRALSYVGWFDSYWAITEVMRLCNDKTPDVQEAALKTLLTQRPSEAKSILRWAAVLLRKETDQGTLPEKNENPIRDASNAS